MMVSSNTQERVSRLNLFLYLRIAITNSAYDTKVIPKMILTLGVTFRFTLPVHPPFKTIRKVHQSEDHFSKLKMNISKWSS
jgi:hypothetical protein